MQDSTPFPFLKEFLSSEKSLPQFLVEYDLINNTSFFIKLNSNETLVHILKCVASEYIASVDISHAVKISEKISHLKEHYFEYIEEKYTLNNFPNIVKYLQDENPIGYFSYISHVSKSFWVKAEVYDYNYTYYTRNVTLGRMLHEMHAEIANT